jgi:tryptophan 2,3-dioxygenase
MTEHHDAKLDFSKDMSYGDYLHLDQVLSASCSTRRASCG